MGHSKPPAAAMQESEELLRHKLNSETGRIAWKELERHFARGAVVKVARGLDLVDVALKMAGDDQAAVGKWLAEGQVARASTEDARDWNARQPTFWAVVAAPWVLVQEAGPPLDA